MARNRCKNAAMPIQITVNALVKNCHARRFLSLSSAAKETLRNAQCHNDAVTRFKEQRMSSHVVEQYRSTNTLATRYDGNALARLDAEATLTSTHVTKTYNVLQYHLNSCFKVIASRPSAGRWPTRMCNSYIRAKCLCNSQKLGNAEIVRVPLRC